MTLSLTGMNRRKRLARMFLRPIELGIYLRFSGESPLFESVALHHSDFDFRWGFYGINW